jgi:hypothetical protein
MTEKMEAQKQKTQLCALALAPSKLLHILAHLTTSSIFDGSSQIGVDMKWGRGSSAALNFLDSRDVLA